MILICILPCNLFDGKNPICVAITFDLKGGKTFNDSLRSQRRERLDNICKITAVKLLN